MRPADASLENFIGITETKLGRIDAANKDYETAIRLNPKLTDPHKNLAFNYLGKGLYELAEKLVDFEDYFRRWRFNHVTTVERIIGFKRGTGGTLGVSYLRKMLDVVLFPELWQIRTQL